MLCPNQNCRSDDTRVLESRSSCGGLAVRRRRECLDCSRRFTTFEIILSNLINPMDMTKFYNYISEKESNNYKSPSETDKLERKEFKKLTEHKSGYYIESINLDKLYGHLTVQEKIIIRMRFYEELTTGAVADFVGISEEKVRSAELKALEFLRDL